jgi:hypothetical protein
VISEQGPRRRPRLSSLQQLGLPLAESVHETRPGMQPEGPSPCCMPALSSEACKVIGKRVLMTFVIMKWTRRESSLLQAARPPRCEGGSAVCCVLPYRRRQHGASYARYLLLPLRYANMLVADEVTA